MTVVVGNVLSVVFLRMRGTPISEESVPQCADDLWWAMALCSWIANAAKHPYCNRDEPVTGRGIRLVPCGRAHMGLYAASSKVLVSDPEGQCPRSSRRVGRGQMTMH